MNDAKNLFLFIESLHKNYKTGHIIHYTDYLSYPINTNDYFNDWNQTDKYVMWLPPQVFCMTQMDLNFLTQLQRPEVNRPPVVL